MRNNIDIDMSFLEELREAKGYSKAQVSYLLNKDYESYYRLKLYGKVKFTSEDIVKLIRIYALDTEDIVKLLNVPSYQIRSRRNRRNRA